VIDPIDRQLLFSSTWIQVGNGEATPFLEAKWLLGAAPKELAPNLFAVARFKRRSVALELHNDNWIRNLSNISTPIQLEEFSMLFMAISDITLDNSNDLIFWKWTADKKFSVASAYECQFIGAMISFSTADIWQANFDHKSKFVAWLVMHNRVLTADNMMKKNWHSNPMCSFCECYQEPTHHILAECNFTEAVWNLVAELFNLPDFVYMHKKGGPSDWFQVLLGGSGNRDKKRKTGILITVWWLIWKERNNRIFDRREKSPHQLVLAIREAVGLFQAVGSSSV
jgi:hypothetical protein